MNVNNDQNNSNSSELVEIEKIENTPFTIVGNNEKGYFLALGMHRLTEPETTKDHVVEQLSHNYWNIIIQLIHIITKYQLTENLNPHQFSEESIINKIKTEQK